MKTFVIAILLGLFLSLPALASNADCAQQMRSHSSKAASGYIYVNRLDAPERSPVSTPGRPAERFTAPWQSAGSATGGSVRFALPLRPSPTADA